MKYRDGFVSNSSTTSFCIAGVYFSDPPWTIEEHEDDWVEYPNVAVYSYDYQDNIYMGLDLDEMNDNETLAQFKERARKELIIALGEEAMKGKTVELFVDGWHD